MRRMLTMSASMLMVLGLTACSGGAGAITGEANTAVSTAEIAETAEGGETNDYTPITMKFSTQSSETALTARAFMDFSDRLAKASDGKVKVDVYCSAVLGNSTESLQGAQMGTVDLSVIQPGGIADMGAPRLNLYCLPYLFENYDQYYNTLYGDVGEALLQDITDNVQGLVGFGYLPDGGRCYFTKGKAIKTLEDIKGMKLRVQAYAIDSDTAGALGFSATPTAFSELYSALQTGVVDGAENPLSGIDGNALYEVSDYLTLDNHTYNIPVLIASKKTWDSLNDATRTLMKETWMQTVEEFYKPQLVDYEAELLEKFREAGVEIITLTDYDKWVEAVQPIWNEYGKGMEDLIAEVQALAK